MAPTYQFYHSRGASWNLQAAAQYYRRMCDTEVTETVQPDGKPRIDVDHNGLAIAIFRAAPGDDLSPCPPGRYLGLDYFGLRAENVDEAVDELKKRGAELATKPVTMRPGLRTAVIRGPENSRMETADHA